MRRMSAVLMVSLLVWGGARPAAAAPVADVEVTARASKAMVDEGERFTIGGTMTGVVDGERVPLAGRAIRVDGGDAGEGRAVTGGDGSYAVSLVAKVPGWFDVEGGRGALARLRVDVRTRLRLGVEQVVPSAGKVRIKGAAQRRPEVSYPLPGVRLVVERGRTRNGPWKAVKKVSSKPNGLSEYPFDVSVPASKLGYWRVRYEGGRYFGPGKTAALRAYRTKATSFRLSRTRAAHGSKVTVSGTAWYTPGLAGTSYKPFKKARMRIEQRCDGNAWTGGVVLLLHGKADARGRFKGTFQAHCTGELRAAFYADSGVLLGHSHTLRMQVPGR